MRKKLRGESRQTHVGTYIFDNSGVFIKVDIRFLMLKTSSTFVHSLWVMLQIYYTFNIKVKERKWSCSVMSNSLRTHGLQPTSLFHSWDFAGKSTGMGCHCLLHYFRNAAAAKSLQSCQTLCDLIDGSPLGFPIPGILQARTLEWVAISFSNAWKWKMKVKSFSRVWFLATPRTVAHQAPLSMGFSRREYCSGLPLPSPNWTWCKRELLSLLLSVNVKIL